MFEELLTQDFINENFHLRMYLDASMAIRGLERVEFHEFFTKQAESEMKHVNEFAKLLFTFNVKIPFNVEKMVSEKIIEYSNKFCLDDNIINWLNALIAMEDEVVTNYTSRIEWSKTLNDPRSAVLESFYQEQLMDSWNDKVEMIWFLR